MSHSVGIENARPPAPELARAEAIRIAFLGALAIVAALGIGCIAFMVVFFAGQPITDALGHFILGRTYYAEYASAGFAVAVLWVWAGAQVVSVPRWRDRLAILLFVAGASAAWRLLARDASGSPCSGLIELGVTLAGGGLGVILAGMGVHDGRLRPRRRALIAGVLLPLLTWTAVVASAWLAPRLGGFAEIRVNRGPVREVRYVGVAAPGDLGNGHEEILWATGATAEAIARNGATGPVLMERIGDSGAGPVTLQAASGAGMRARIEDAARSYLRWAFAAGIEDGSLPPVCARVPLPRVDLRGAEFFRVIR